VVLVRLDMSRVSLALDADVGADGSIHPWTINATPHARAAAVAFNGGQFSDAGPWGWIVHEAREVQAPGRGALAGALAVHSDGSTQIVDPDSVHAVRSNVLRRPIREAMQSYPTLLTTGGRVPAALRDDENSAVAIDLRHRDARLAIGELRDGRLLIALTRFDGFGAILGPVPLGLTVPEMAALMGGLGCHRALMLDGGISAQLGVRDGARGRREWTGLRRVPLGVIVSPRRVQ
jgi:exopolysaccharide biosynthesis protein